MQLKKHIFLLFLFSFASKYSFAQQMNISSWSIGIIAKTDYFKTDIDKHYLFGNSGISSTRQLNSNWEIALNALFSHRKYDFKNFSSLQFSTPGKPNPPPNPNTPPTTVANENLLEFENHISYLFSPKKSRPFLGLGYTVQIPIKVEGSINDKINFTTLDIPEDVKPTAKFGLHALAGYQIHLHEKVRWQVGFEYKFFTNSNADIYQYEKSRSRKIFGGGSTSRKDVDHSFLLSTSFLYRLGSKI